MLKHYYDRERKDTQEIGASAAVAIVDEGSEGSSIDVVFSYVQKENNDHVKVND